MTLADDNRNLARRRVIANAEAQVALNLKRSWNMLRQFVGNRLPQAPDDRDFERMARELIDNGTLTPTPGGQPIPLSIIDAVLQANDTGRNVLRELGVTNLRQMIPRREQINLIADEVGNGVAENVGSIGFLRGATISSALMGLFSWIFSGFSGGFQGLMEGIANVTGNNMRQSVTGNLFRLRQRLRNGDNDISHFMTDTAIGEIGNQVQQAPRDSLNPNPAPAPTLLQQLGGVERGDMSPLRAQTQAVMRDVFRDEILNGFRANEDFRDALPPNQGAPPPGFWEGRWTSARDSVTGLLGTSGAQRRRAVIAITNAVSERLSIIIADPAYTVTGDTLPSHLQALRGRNLASMSQEDRARVLAWEARRTIESLAPASGDERLLYQAIALQMQPQIEAAVNRRHSSIPWFISGNTANLDATTRSDPGPQVFSIPLALLLAAPTPGDRINTLTGRLQRSLAPTTEEGARLQQAAGGPLQEAHFRAIATALSDGANILHNDMERIRALPRDEQYAEVARLLRERMRQPGTLAAVNNAVPGQPRHFTAETMTVIADQATVEFLGNPVPDVFACEMRHNEILATNSVIREQIERSLNANAADLQALVTQPPGAPAPVLLTPQHFTAIATAVAPTLAQHMTTPEAASALRAMGPNGYAHVADQTFTAMENTLLDGVVLSPAARRMMAGRMALQFIESIHPPGQAPDPEVFRTAMAQHTNSLVSAEIMTNLQLPATRTRLQRAAGTTPMTDAHLTLLSDAAARAISPLVVDPGAWPRLPGGGYDPVIYAQLSEAIAVNLRTVNGTPLSRQARESLADEIAVRVIETRLGAQRPNQPPAFQDAAARRERLAAVVIIAPQVQEGLRSRAARLQQAAGGTALSGQHYNAMAEAVQNVIARYATGQTALPAGEAGYTQLTEEIRQALVANRGNINGGGVNFHNDALASVADNITVQAIRNLRGDQAPPAAFTRLMEERERTAMTSVVRDQVGPAVTRTIAGYRQYIRDNAVILLPAAARGIVSPDALADRMVEQIDNAALTNAITQAITDSMSHTQWANPQERERLLRENLGARISGILPTTFSIPAYTINTPIGFRAPTFDRWTPVTGNGTITTPEVNNIAIPQTIRSGVIQFMVPRIVDTIRENGLIAASRGPGPLDTERQLALIDLGNLPLPQLPNLSGNNNLMGA